MGVGLDSRHDPLVSLIDRCCKVSYGFCSCSGVLGQVIVMCVLSHILHKHSLGHLAAASALLSSWAAHQNRPSLHCLNRRWGYHLLAESWTVYCLRLDPDDAQNGPVSEQRYAMVGCQVASSKPKLFERTRRPVVGAGRWGGERLWTSND